MFGAEVFIVTRRVAGTYP